MDANTFKNRKNNTNREGVNKKKFKNSFKGKFKNSETNVQEKIKKFKRGIANPKIDREKLKKYERGQGPNLDMVKVKFEQKKIAEREKKIRFGVKQSVRSEVLLTEECGYLEPDDGEPTHSLSQSRIKDSVDPLSASKSFDLHLKEFGPYRMNYTRNGRFLLLGGRMGHVAALDWIKKKLLCEINVMESVHDVAWLHQETFYAVAQKKWVYFYDNNGIEIHCVKILYNVVRMMFLPYHFLLSTVSANGFISWLDVSIGKLVNEFRLNYRGMASAIALHPGNGMICVGEPNGHATFWSPNSKKPAVNKWCHNSPICAVAFDPQGLNFVTAGVDQTVKIWDARNLKGPMQKYVVKSAPKCMTLSHRGMIALGLGNSIDIFKDVVKNGVPQKDIYLRHRVPDAVVNMEFCPFEDILGVAHSHGFTSMLVPGCGEPNFDALEVNPFQTKSQRKEAEVKALLNKIPSDLITWDTTELRMIDIPSLEEMIEAKKQIAHIKPPDIHFVPKKKMGKQAGSVKAAQRKKIMKNEFRRSYVKQMKELKGDAVGSENKAEEDTSPTKSVLDRFKAKPRN